GWAAGVVRPPGGWLEFFGGAPRCVNAIEPVGGWKPEGLTTTADLAVTSLKAIDRESDLPPADLAIEKTGVDFLIEQANLLAGGSDPDAPRGEGLDRPTLRARGQGLR